MKLTLAAAGALLLGTSAMAWAPGADDSDNLAWKDAGVKSSVQLKYAINDVLAKSKAEPALASAAWADETFKSEPAAWTAEPMQVQPAAATWVDDEADLPAAKDEPKLVEDGVGGPLETVDATAADLAPRPAAQNYPACEPGPGDDHCIQLYEPGVRASLASWNAPTGGLVDHQATTAMGGPYEPVDDAALEHEDMAASAEAADAAYAGTGGPIAETGYPPCRSRSDDRCIQLYEPGVTGAGN